MPDDLTRAAAFGIIGTLLAFELVAALRSWYDANAPRTGGPDAHRLGDRSGPILLSQAFAIRDHFARRRQLMNDLRPRYAVLRTGRYGRQLRTAIGRVQPGPFSEVAAGCSSCRLSRLRGQAHCSDCHRRLLVPMTSASI